jgi:hypothetical protein
MAKSEGGIRLAGTALQVVQPELATDASSAQTENHP